METLSEYPELNEAESDIAYRRVDAMLRAFGLEHAAIRGGQTHRILRTSIDIQRKSGQPLEAIAAARVFEELTSGLAQLTSHLSELGDALSEEKLLLALRKTDIPRKHPQVLLGSESATPAELEALVATYRTQNMPEVKRMSMGAPTIRFETIEEVTSTTYALIERVPLLNKLVPLGIAAGFLFVMYTFAQ